MLFCEALAVWIRDILGINVFKFVAVSDISLEEAVEL
jgi:hypothetical protein